MYFCKNLATLFLGRNRALIEYVTIRRQNVSGRVARPLEDEVQVLGEEGGDRRDDRWGGRNGGGRQMDERPILFKIYNGKVTGLKEFGAFVTLEGVMGRVEGISLSFTLG